MSLQTPVKSILALFQSTYTEVDTSTGTNTDSVVLPAAIPGSEVVINNNTANTITVFASLSNPNNNSAADKIVDTSSTAQVASVTMASGLVSAFICFQIGVWKRVKSAA